ncbi:hypothetical protein [Phenylobacterium soli]|uniref:Excalibur calcium-binding domain-containing protein n=1 Tax=Phenylobacterium soli TaxID=2170551 RepID=A0A328AM00_9CAUL|nr:hypothetical protein [Phenylobacterium soli]RAK55385.1 hypothetical protein DJ017_13105 [Phenylobacterium soli]
MKALPATLVLALGLAACASASPVGGVANYDALKKAHADCAAKGGTLVLQRNGDPEYIGDYACERK